MDTILIAEMSICILLQDLRNIRKEYVAKGITFIAAAIGSDKEAIKRCYGEQCFLDITDCAIRS